MSIDWSGFVNTVRQANRFLLTTHARPDCDALGSELGMAGILETLGKTVHVVNADAVPARLAFIDPGHKIQTLGQQVSADNLPEVEVLMVLDTSAWAQLGAMADVVRATSAKKVVIDHHVSGDDLGAELYKDPQAESTGGLVYAAAAALGVELTADIAQPLFAAIATDTGWFRFISTTGDTLRAAAALVDAGARPETLYRDLFECDSHARILLIGKALGRTEVYLDGRLATTTISAVDFASTGADPSETEDIVNYLLRISGTEAAVIFIETPGEAVWRVSFRSRKNLDCSAVASQFGGGGHRAAAGARISGGYDDVKPQVLKAIEAVMG